MCNILIITLNTKIRGYAPGLALQVSGVSDFFGSGFDGVLLLLSRLRLLDSFGDQLTDGFAHGVLIFFGRRSFDMGIGLVLDHDHLLLPGGSLRR